MLKLANVDVAETYRQFKGRAMAVTFLVPTATGLGKYIMDATADVRKYLRESGAHDYDAQPQGEDHKRCIDTILVSDGQRFDTSTSLYRPETKQGDPRIWIGGLRKRASEGDLLAIGFADGTLVAINCSTTDLDSYLDREDSAAQLLRTRGAASSVFEELLHKLRDIAAKGYINTMRPGDTGVGYTLETLLGIAANSSKKPDYRGIELKASRRRTSLSGQSTVFSQVPNWKDSRLKSSREILEARGRHNEEKQRLQLYHEISTKAPNSYGLKLEIDDDVLRQLYVPEDGPEVRDVLWHLDKLKQRVAEKHRETAWITARTEGPRGADEKFWYTSVKHAQGVDPNALPILLESGAMTVHYLIKRLPNGAAKDQGYLFKTSTKNLDLLFASLDEYRLAD